VAVNHQQQTSRRLLLLNYKQLNVSLFTVHHELYRCSAGDCGGIATVFVPLAQRMRSSLKFGNVGEGIPGVDRRGRWVGFRVSSKKKRNICVFAVILTTPGFQSTPPMECLRPEDRYNIRTYARRCGNLSGGAIRRDHHPRRETLH